ncbi:MAG: hypothetical protein V9H26_11035, partial [Verrucomicrobiota bacterium]
MDTYAKELILFSLIPAGITIPVTAFLCGVRVAHKHRVAYGTMLLGVFIVMFCWVVIFTGGAFFSPNYWHSIISTIDRTHWTRFGDGEVLNLKSFAFSAAISLLPAFGVVHYYQKRSKRDETPVA